MCPSDSKSVYWFVTTRTSGEMTGRLGRGNHRGMNCRSSNERLKSMPNLLLSESVRNLIMSILACMEHFEIFTGLQIKDWVYTCLWLMFELAFWWGFFVLWFCQNFLFSLSCSLNGIWQWKVYLYNYINHLLCK